MTDSPAPHDGGRYPARIEPPAPPRPTREVFAEEWDDEIRLADYWRLLVNRKWTILGVVFTVAAATLLWSVKQEPVYRATSRIQIEREDPSILSFENVYSAETGTDDGLQTQYEIMASRTLAQRVVQELSPQEVEQYLVSEEDLLSAWMREIRAFFMPGDALPARDSLDSVVDEYLDRLTVTPVRQARLVDVSFDHEDPEFAARVIDIHADYFIDQNLRFRFEATQLASEFLSENLTNLKIDLERAEDELQEYSREHQIVFSQDGDNTALLRLEQLQSDYSAAENDRIAWEAYIEVLENGDATAIAQVAEDELIGELSNDLSQLRAQAAELSATLGPRMPETQRLESRIVETERLLDQARSNVLDTVEAEYQAAVVRERLLRASLENQLELVNDVNQEIVQYSILRGEVDASRQLYQEMLTRLGEANVSSTLRASNIRIIDRATVPAVPVRPRKALNLALSLIVGLALGVGAAFVQEHLDDSITSAEDIGQFLGVPTLGIVPNAASVRHGYGYHGGYGPPLEPVAKSPQDEVYMPAIRSDENRLEFIGHNEPGSIVSEAYRSIRTSLLLSFPDRPPTALLVTSPAPSEGKTATAINLAISLTHTGARALLVSTDLRKPKLDRVFGTRSGGGIAGVLSGDVGLESAIVETGVPNLSILPCGVLPPNPVELLMSKRFQLLVSALRCEYDFVVFDSPPVGHVSDARVLARYMDCTILVVRAGQTSRHLAHNVLDQLTSTPGSNTAGVVLNDCDATTVGEYAYTGAYKTRAAHG